MNKKISIRLLCSFFALLLLFSAPVGVFASTAKVEADISRVSLINAGLSIDAKVNYHTKTIQASVAESAQTLVLNAPGEIAISKKSADGAYQALAYADGVDLALQAGLNEYQVEINGAAGNSVYSLQINNADTANASESGKYNYRRYTSNYSSSSSFIISGNKWSYNQKAKITSKNITETISEYWDDNDGSKTRPNTTYYSNEFFKGSNSYTKPSLLFYTGSDYTITKLTLNGKNIGIANRGNYGVTYYVTNTLNLKKGANTIVLQYKSSKSTDYAKASYITKTYYINSTIATSATAPAVPIKSLKIAKTASGVREGSKLQLKAAVTPANATNRKLTWKSSHPSIASVTSTGLVKATGSLPGNKTVKVKITATAKNGEKTATYWVSVRPKVDSVQLKYDEVSIERGTSLRLTATVLPTNAYSRTVKWSSSNSKIATVAADGTVKVASSVKNGTKVTITVTTNDGKKQDKVVVTAIVYSSSGPVKPTIKFPPTFYNNLDDTYKDGVRVPGYESSCYMSSIAMIIDTLNNSKPKVTPVTVWEQNGNSMSLNSPEALGKKFNVTISKAPIALDTADKKAHALKLVKQYPQGILLSMKTVNGKGHMVVAYYNSAYPNEVFINDPYNQKLNGITIESGKGYFKNWSQIDNYWLVTR